MSVSKTGICRNDYFRVPLARSQCRVPLRFVVHLEPLTDPRSPVSVYRKTNLSVSPLLAPTLPKYCIFESIASPCFSSFPQLQTIPIPSPCLFQVQRNLNAVVANFPDLRPFAGYTVRHELPLHLDYGIARMVVEEGDEPTLWRQVVHGGSWGTQYTNFIPTIAFTKASLRQTRSVTSNIDISNCGIPRHTTSTWPGMYYYSTAIGTLIDCVSLNSQETWRRQGPICCTALYRYRPLLQ